MKKILSVTFFVFLIGCEKKPPLVEYAKVKSSQKFLCSGYWHEKDVDKKYQKQIRNNYKKVEYKVTIKKWGKVFDSLIGRTLGSIYLEDFESFPICYESEFRYTFFPSCDVSSIQEGMSNSNHLGLIDKVNGDISYEIRYDVDNITRYRDLRLQCKPAEELLIK